MSHPEERMITTGDDSELQCLNIGIAAFSEVWTPDCGEIMIMAGGYTSD